MTGAIVPPTIALPPRSATALAEAMAETTTQATVLRRWGIVAAINDNGTLDVLVGGQLIPGLKRNASYTPTVGERVLLDAVGTDMTVIGATGPSPRNFNRPTGDVEITIRKTAKPDTLFLQGQTIKRTDYPKLFAWVVAQDLLTTAQSPNNLFGPGDGTTTFTLPDFRNRALIGASTALPLGSTVGADSRVLTTDQMPSHNHSVAVTVPDHAAHTHGFSATGGDHSHTVSVAAGGSHYHTNAFNTNSAGAHAGHSNFPSSVASNATGGSGFSFPTSYNVTYGSHSHSVSGDTSTIGNHSHTGSATSNTHTHSGTTNANAAQPHTPAVTQNNVGGTTPVDLRQPSYAVNWLIWI